MKISYNWLKWYIPEAPEANKLADVFTFHLCEVDSMEKNSDGDFIFDLKILPDRAHDLLSHQGVARELASLLNIKFIDPTSKYKVPISKPTELKIKIESDKCRRYMGRIIRGIKVGTSPEWVVKHLESIGQRSINNIVDAANIVMFDCGQPTHVFDLDKVKNEIIVRDAKGKEEMTTLDGKKLIFRNDLDLVIADSKDVLAVAGIKGGKIAEVDINTKNIILEVANFDPASVRKTAQALNIVTDAKKRFENDLSSELGSFAMLEFSALIFEIFPEAIFEDVVDIYPHKQPEKHLSFSVDKISKILGVSISIDEIENILKRYNFAYEDENKHKKNEGEFDIIVPPMRLDLSIEEDMAEEIGRILGYDKVIEQMPKIDLPRLGKAGFTPKPNEIYSKILWSRNKLLNDGYSEVMTYVFRDKGEVEVLASASDKKFLRTNLTDGLKESLKLNQINASLLGTSDIKIFEIGTVFKKNGEEMHVAYGNKKEIKEETLNEYTKLAESFLNGLAGVGDPENRGPEKMTLPIEVTNSLLNPKFKMWSLFPFIARDVAVWVPEGIKSLEVGKIINDNMGDMVVRGPELFDEFRKDGKISYAFNLIFQSYERTLIDQEVNDIMTKITNKIKDNDGWQVR